MVNTELNVCVAMAGYGGKAIGFKLGGTGDITATNRLWQSTEKPPQRIGTGVMVGKHLFMVQEPGFLCVDPLTGKDALGTTASRAQVFWGSITASAIGFMRRARRARPLSSRPIQRSSSCWRGMRSARRATRRWRFRMGSFSCGRMGICIASSR